MSPGGAPVRRQAGFTLIELLAALAVGAVVLAGLAGLVRNVGLTFERGTRGVGNAERVLLAVERLAADFASARFIVHVDDAGRPAVLFDGDPERVVFVTAGHAAIGPRRDEVVAFAIEREGGLTRLVRRRAPFSGPRAGLARVVPADPVVLLEGQLALRFAFAASASDGKTQWTDRWVERAALPRQVRLLARDPGSGADLLAPAVLSIRADAPASCALEASVACISAGSPSTDAPAPGGPGAGRAP